MRQALSPPAWEMPPPGSTGSSRSVHAHGRSIVGCGGSLPLPQMSASLVAASARPADAACLMHDSVIPTTGKTLRKTTPLHLPRCNPPPPYAQEPKSVLCNQSPMHMPAQPSTVIPQRQRPADQPTDLANHAVVPHGPPSLQRRGPGRGALGRGYPAVLALPAEAQRDVVVAVAWGGRHSRRVQARQGREGCACVRGDG